MTIDTLALITDLIDDAKKLGADAADAVSFSGAENTAVVRLGEVESIERSESRGFGLRVMVGKRKAIVSSTDIKPDVLRQMVARAVDMAKLMPEDPFTQIAPGALVASDMIDLDLHDKNEPSTDQLADIAGVAEAAALDVEGITNSEGADASYSVTNFALATSEGFAQKYITTSSSISACVVAGEGTGMERDYEFSVARHASDLMSADQIGQKAAQRAIERLHPKKPDTGQVPVIFDPRVAKNIIGSFAGAINGASVARGTSFLKDKMHQQIFSKGITIINDPLIVRGLSSRPYDGEGIGSQKHTIVDDGELVSWLLDIRSANQLGLETNGSASRGLASDPSPSCSNFYLQAGDISPSALLKDVQSGFYVTDTFGTGVNLITGDYSQGASGFWIENGEITYPVSELTIASTLGHMYSNLQVANDLEFKYSVNSPTIRIDGVTVAGV